MKGKVKTLVICGVLVLMPSFMSVLAFSQGMPAGIPQRHLAEGPSTGARLTKNAYESLGLAIETWQQENVAKLAEAKKELGELREYAVKCGDKPGCFIPVGKEESK